MARYHIVGPFQFRTRTGEIHYYNPAIEADPVTVFDTADARWDLPPGWLPPPVGLRPMDQDAADALVTVRAPFVGVQTPGLGVVPDHEPVWVP